MLSQVTLPGDKNQTELMLPGSSQNNGGGTRGSRAGAENTGPFANTLLTPRPGCRPTASEGPVCEASRDDKESVHVRTPASVAQASGLGRDQASSGKPSLLSEAGSALPPRGQAPHPARPPGLTS